ncbi:right-handed parallel beta-helix repeat-containing protein [Alkalicoccobacillus porphyridii]|uniref:Right handed beta helix domain-containing protein n=1 Tax=Alkalicoccobacillus porphyridii TaxID=2597270 RepID=A0A553ZTJ9_9BACI|nr:right-handed parallel beta-helix repeat-containing protein [Alkalicoccobacillus porphyridii]TSB44790.1 hypothetical protein FN960_19495 [Alkalicoccobacillus porphyridii]
MKDITVSQKILSKYKQLQQALEVAEDGDSIRLEQGLYKGIFTIDKSITITGIGHKDEVILQGSIHIKNTAVTSVSNLTIQDGKTGVLVEEDSSITLTGCDINRMKSSAVTVRKGSRAALREVIMQRNHHAVLCDGKVSLLYCALSKQRDVQVKLTNNGRMVLKHSHIFQGAKEAVTLLDTSQMMMEDCSVYGHAGPQPQISVNEHTSLSVTSSTVYEGEAGGITVIGGRLLVKDSELYRNHQQQILLVDCEALIKNSYLHSGDIGCNVQDGTILKVEQTRFVAHLQAQLRVNGGQVKAKQCSILSGNGNAVLISSSGEAVLSDSEVAGHHLPQVCVSEQGNILIERCAIHHGEHYGVWLTEQSSATILQSNVYQHQQIQIVVAEQSFLEMDATSVYEGYENGLHLLEESKAHITNCEFARHGHEFPQVIIRRADPTFVNCTLQESASNGMWFIEEAKGRVENCRFIQHGLAQLEITEGSTPVITGAAILEGGDCAIHIHEAGPYIENCSYTDNTASIILEGDCPAEIIGEGAEALSDYAEQKREAAERLANMDEKTMERLQKSQELAEKEAKTAEIVGLVEELERRLGKGY